MARRQPKEPETAAYVVLNDDIEDPAELLESTSAIRAMLSKATRLTAEIVVDLESKGALFAFVKETRKDAIEAVLALLNHDPTDAAGIYALQRRAHPYFDACRFIKESLQAGANADQTIEEMYSDGDTPGD